MEISETDGDGERPTWLEEDGRVFFGVMCGILSAWGAQKYATIPDEELAELFNSFKAIAAEGGSSARPPTIMMYDPSRLIVKSEVAVILPPLHDHSSWWLVFVIADPCCWRAGHKSNS